jgi:hypothetical protein
MIADQEIVSTNAGGLAVIGGTGLIVDRDAIEIGELYRNARTSFVDSAKYLIECGNRLIAKKESPEMGHGTWLPWLKENEDVLGFSSRVTAARLMACARSNVALTQHLDESSALAISRQTWGNKDSQLIQQSTSNEHYTPLQYVDAARDVLGEIDLDPASCEEANETVGATSYFDASDNGLDRDWRGRVWLNPPYGNLVGEFVAKLVAEHRAGNVPEAILLVNAHCTDTAWFQPLWNGCLCFTDHRINFYGDDTRSGSTHGSVFVYLGDRVGEFANRFSEFGAVVRRVTP